MTKQGTPLEVELAQSGDGGALRRIGRIIAHPGFEQIAENVQGRGARAFGRQKLQELLGNAVATRVDVQIRYEQRRPLGQGLA